MKFVWIAAKLTLILGAIFGSAQSSFAITPTEYRAKIDDARALAAEVLLELGEFEAGDTDEIHGKEDSDILRELLPVTQNVETANGTVESSNQWLHDRLNDFDAASDVQAKAVVMTEIQERLTAISWSIGELEQAASSDRTKDQEKQKLSEILLREEYQKPPEQQESQLERWMKSIMEWISSLFPKPSPSSGTGFGLQSFSHILRIVLIGIVALVLLFGLYKLAGLLFPAMKRKRREKREDRVVLGETIGADQSAETLFDEAESFARSGDLRMAIRKGYIALLCELSDRKVIGLQRHKTNRDYLKDVRSNSGLHSNMSGLTSSFERHWYGDVTGDETAWSEFREQYRDAITSSRA
jgi:negative regulator of replication initiation